MNKGIICSVVGLLFIGFAVSSSYRASADHLFATEPETFPDPDRINLVRACFVLHLKKLTYPANHGFFVSHGWTNPDWDETPDQEKHAFMLGTTRFQLLVDGELQRSALHASFFQELGTLTDVMSKLFVIEDHDGMTETHFLTGQWFLDGSISPTGGSLGEAVLQFECNLRVTFS